MNKTTNNQQTNNRKDELGALWKKKSKTGMSFLSGYIIDHDGARTDVVVFANSKKTNEKAPDYRLYVSKPLAKENSPKAQTPARRTQEQAQDNDDDIL